PVLAAYLLKHSEKPARMAAWFNRGFDRVINGYGKTAAWMVDHSGWVAIPVLILALAGCVFMFRIIPTTLVPQEDQGYVFTFATLPEGPSLTGSEAVTKEINPIAMNNPAVQSVVAMTGFSLLENLNRTNIGTYFVIL